MMWCWDQGSQDVLLLDNDAKCRIAGQCAKVGGGMEFAMLR